MGGGCELPLGAHCTPIEQDWLLHAQVLSRDGEQSVQLALPTQVGEPPESLGRRAAEILISRGALDLLNERVQA